MKGTNTSIMLFNYWMLKWFTKPPCTLSWIKLGLRFWAKQKTYWFHNDVCFSGATFWYTEHDPKISSNNWYTKKIKVHYLKPIYYILCFTKNPNVQYFWCSILMQFTNKCYYSQESLLLLLVFYFSPWRFQTQ